MSAKYILVAVALVFAIAAIARGGRRTLMSNPQARVWMLVALILGVVSGCLFVRGS